MLHTLVEIAATVSDVLFLVYFVSRFHHTAVYERLWTLTVPLGMLVFQILGDHFLGGFDLFYIVGLFLFSYAYSLLLCRKKYFRAVISVCFYIAILMLVNSMVYTVFAFFIDSMDTVIQGAVSNARLIYLVVCKLVQFSMYQLVLVFFKSDESIDWKNGILVFLFSLATALGLGALMKISVTTEMNEQQIPILLLVFLLIFVNVILYVMIYQVQKLQKQKYELKLMQEKMAFEKARVEEANVIWDNIRKVRHDLKNHLTVITGQLNAGDISACQEYLKSLYYTIENMGTLIRSGNSVIDYLINSKLSNLQGVQVLVSGCVGNFKDIDDVDLACMLGNILDNAVEAQKYVTSVKRIELHFLMKNTNRIIICKNSIEKSVLKTNKHLKSTKSSPESHGLGHQIIENVVAKHHGLLDYFEQDGMFGVQIVLPQIDL